MKKYVKWEDENGNFFFQVFNDSDEEIASVEKELIEEGYVIYGVGSLCKQGNAYPTILAKKFMKETENEAD